MKSINKMYFNMRTKSLLWLVTIILIGTSPAHGREQVYFESDTLFEKNNTLYAKGNVKFRQNNYLICSQSADYNTVNGALSFADDVQISMKEGEFTGQAVDYNVQTNEAAIHSFDGTINDTNLRIYGEQIHLTPQDFFISSVYITSCPVESEDWKLFQDITKIDRLEKETEVSNAVFFLGDIPIAYLPYWRFYYGEEAKTGFLSPDISIKSSGIGGKTPYYFRIADNIDMTMTPNFDTEYGFELGNQLRFLTDEMSGEIEINHVLDDSRGRQLIKLESNANAAYKTSPWRWWINGSNISDDDYYKNFGETAEETSQRNLPRVIGISYNRDTWRVRMDVKTYKTLDSDLIPPSQMLPQITYHYNKDDLRHHFRYTRFKNPYSATPDTDRLLFNNELNSDYQIKNFNIHSSLGINGGYHIIDKQKNQFVLVPHVQLETEYHQNFTWNEKSDSHILWRTALMYAPYRKQNEIIPYTTRGLASSLSNIYEWNRFIGGDRYGDISALTYGFEHRLYNVGHEYFFLGVGQRYYFSKPRVSLPWQQQQKSGAGNLLMESYFNEGDKWRIKSDAEFNTQTGTTERFYIDLNWRSTKKKFKFGYLTDTSETIVAGFSTPLFSRVEGSYDIDYSLTNNQATQSRLSFNIEDDCGCWELHLGFVNRVISADKRNSEFKVGIVFSGLASVGKQYDNDFDAIE